LVVGLQRGDVFSRTSSTLPSLRTDYHAITPPVRLKIWRARLAACELNGRDVQKVLRLAKPIAAERREPCAYAHLQQIAATRERL
jgi:hypothetical protein